MTVAATAEEGESEALSRWRIHDVIMRYCRGIDRCDEELVRSAFWPEAVDNHMGASTPSSIAIPSMIRSVEEQFVATTHFIGNELVELNGDSATSESYFLAIHRIPKRPVELDWVVGGRYVDVLTCRRGEWRIAIRQVVYDWQRVDIVDMSSASEYADAIVAALRGARSREDVSYHLWARRGRETPHALA